MQKSGSQQCVQRMWHEFLQKRAEYSVLLRTDMVQYDTNALRSESTEKWAGVLQKKQQMD